MRKGTLTRQQAIIEAGRDAVERLDEENCDYSGRLQTDGDDSVEFIAAVDYEDNEGGQLTLVAYYYQREEDLASVEDLDQLDWEIEGYDVI